MRVKIYPYKLGSESARDLARALRVKRIIPGGRYSPTRYTKVINWGSSAFHFPSLNTINEPRAVATASNKLSALQVLKQAGVSTVEFTDSQATVRGWLNLGNKVVVRHKLSANSGDGIQILRNSYDVPYARLYTKYMKKDREFRIHVFQGRVFDFQEKKKKSGVVHEEGSDNHLIRSHLNGWIFCRTGVSCPEYIKSEAIRAVAALGLDFGAVDVIDARGRPYILEVNTAPGLENTTLQNYVAQFRRAIYGQSW